MPNQKNTTSLFVHAPPGLLVLIAILFWSVLPDQVLAISGHKELRINHDGRNRTYFVHIPPAYNTATSLPVVIVLHGGAGNANNAIRMTGMSAKADSAGFIAVYPNGTGLLKKRVLTWNAANCCGYAKRNDVDDVGFIREMIAKLQQDYRINMDRIYVTGMSNGGMMAFRLGCELADIIAAIAPVAAAFNDEDCKPAAPVSVIMFNGTLDKRVPFDGGTGEETIGDRIDRSVSEAITFWIHHNENNPISKISQSYKGTILREEFSGGKNGTALVLYTIKGSGHAWPGGKRGYLFGDIPSTKISATDIIWEFFKQHPKSGKTEILNP